MCLCFLFVLLSFYPTFYELGHRDRLQPNRYFELVHNFPTDYNFYLSRIRQGIEGRTSVIEQYTSEPHKGSYIQVFYLFLGWLGRWTRVPWGRSGDVYHVARFVFGMLLMVLIGEYCKRSFSNVKDKLSVLSFRLSDFGRSVFSQSVTDKPKTDKQETENRQLKTDNWAILAFLLAVTASTWPKLVAVINDNVVQATLANITHWRFGGYMAWWSVMDSLQRITHIPHLLAGQALVLFIIMMISDTTVLKKPGSWVFLGILGLLLGIIFPPGLLFVFVTIGILIVLELLFDKPTKINYWIASHVSPRIVFVFISIPSFIYLMLMTSFYPWKRLVDVDIIRPLPFEYLDYFKAVGPLLLFGMAGLFIAFKKKEKAMLPSVAWVMSWLILLGAFRFVPQQSPLRFSEMIPHVPLGVLSAYLFFTVWRGLRSQQNFLDPLLAGLPFLKSIVSKNVIQSFKGIRFKLGKRSAKILSFATSPFLITYHLSLITPIALIAIGLGVMYSSILWQRDFIDHKMRATLPLVPTGSYVMYPLKDFMAAIYFLKDATDVSTVILSETTAGNYIPVHSGNRVFVGHDNTVDFEKKQMFVRDFFGTAMTADQARLWLLTNNLHIIFFGPQEREDAGGIDVTKVYPFLEIMYQNDLVTVYRVK